ncbi:hypothetical protein T440DRAFT_293083 [Plenodomus tracheiphilus IPT5]|uniref:Uncharacterized protein n=1 Tax=Plenodomus tracheiphilus IPT5 TaxID=1408161 RepID=A0A6A7BEQ6_9PLEO|nr:hypothetical protein T440DRAFT_293083 [Plenodomus tracheiphilus IPT5]
MTHLVRKSGIPALAYPKCDAASPISLSLLIICNESPAQATVCLQTSLFIRGFDDAQTFILQYDADNFVSGPLSLTPAFIPLPQSRLHELARHGNPQIHTLSFTLKKVCPVWCAPSSVPLAPQDGFKASFDQLTNLAKATELHILFDCNWLHRDAHVPFHRLVEHPEELSGFPVNKHYRKLYRCVDWTVFNTGGADTHADADATTEEDEPPPTYAEASSKRRRHVSTSPTPACPPAKRILSSHLGDIHTTPPEKGATSIPNPKLPHDLAALSSKPASVAATNPESPHSSTAPTPDLQHAVNQAVSALLPSILDTLLPNVLDSLLPSLLPRILTTSSPEPSYSQQSIASQISYTPPPATLSAFGITFTEHVARKVEGELGKIYAHTLSHAKYLRNTADLEVEDVLEEGRLQFGIEKQDTLDEVERVVDEKLQAFRETCEGLGEYVQESVGEKAELVVDDTKQRLDELGHKEKVNLERDREELSKDKEELMREKEELRRDKEELRRERKHSRRERKILRRDQKRFESEKRTTAHATRHDE